MLRPGKTKGKAAQQQVQVLVWLGDPASHLCLRLLQRRGRCAAPISLLKLSILHEKSLALCTFTLWLCLLHGGTLADDCMLQGAGQHQHAGNLLPCACCLVCTDRRHALMVGACCSCMLDALAGSTAMVQPVRLCC